jgi:hypothetical protein
VQVCSMSPSSPAARSGSVVDTIEAIGLGAASDPNPLPLQAATTNTIDANMASKRWNFTLRDATHLDRSSDVSHLKPT